MRIHDSILLDRMGLGLGTATCRDMEDPNVLPRRRLDRGHPAVVGMAIYARWLTLLAIRRVLMIGSVTGIPIGLPQRAGLKGPDDLLAR